MKYRITNNLCSEQPCAEAKPEWRPCWDKRTFATEAEHDQRFPKQPWRSHGTEHGTWSLGYGVNKQTGIKRRIADEVVWVVEVDSIEQLYKLYGDFEVKQPYGADPNADPLELEIVIEYRYPNI